MLSVKLDKINILNKNSSFAILHEIDFTIPNNSVYTILGSNGSGKSTLLKAIPRLLNSNVFEVKGNVIIEGVDILSLPEKKLNDYRKSKIKIVFQDAANCFDPLRRLNYYFKLADSNNNIDWDPILKKFLLPDFAEISKKYPYELSIGQAQRLNFALALVVNPRILLLDEPTSALDVINNNLFKYIIEDYISQSTNSILLVTHDISFAKEVSSKVAILNNSTLSEFVDVGNIDTLYNGRIKDLFLED